MDILIKNSKIYDFNKNKFFIGGVSIVNGKIAEVFNKESAIPQDKFEKVIDGEKLFLLPGLFDVCSRSELSMIDEPNRKAHISQGFTTELIGGLGFSVAPVTNKNYMIHQQNITDYLANPHVSWTWETTTEYLKKIDKKINTNSIFYTPLGTVILESDLNPTFSKITINSILNLLEKSLDEGSSGFSVSTSLSPSSVCFKKDEYIFPILKLLKKYNKILCVCVEGSREIEKDLERAFFLAKKFNLKLHITRLIEFNIKKALPIIEKKKKDLEDLLIDSSSVLECYIKLRHILPDWLNLEDVSKIKNKIKKSENVKKLIKDLSKNFTQGLERFRLIYTENKEMKKYEGSFLSSIALEQNKSISDFLIQLIDTDLENVLFEYPTTELDVISKLFSYNFSVPATGGYFMGREKPDLYSLVPRFLKLTTKKETKTEDNISNLINKLHKKPSKFFNMKSGINVGNDANVFLLDLDKFSSKADCINPNILAEGVRVSIINGGLVYIDNEFTGLHKGKFLNWI
jgi:N-acyl-D-amino-acid deacylase